MRGSDQRDLVHDNKYAQFYKKEHYLGKIAAIKFFFYHRTSEYLILSLPLNFIQDVNNVAEL